ncbi:hypothetical protein Droror1_Dr00009570 [Drosera rotundifolia]
MAHNTTQLISSIPLRRLLRIADTASWYISILLTSLILLATLRQTYPFDTDHLDHHQGLSELKGEALVGQRPCDEIYVVGEGETLNTISDKCGDPYIVERNPHIQDPDDVFPGLVIRILASKNHKNRKLLER